MKYSIQIQQQQHHIQLLRETAGMRRMELIALSGAVGLGVGQELVKMDIV